MQVRELRLTPVAYARATLCVVHELSSSHDHIVSLAQAAPITNGSHKRFCGERDPGLDLQLVSPGGGLVLLSITTLAIGVQTSVLLVITGITARKADHDHMNGWDNIWDAGKRLSQS